MVNEYSLAAVTPYRSGNSSSDTSIMIIAIRVVTATDELIVRDDTDGNSVKQIHFLQYSSIYVLVIHLFSWSSGEVVLFPNTVFRNHHSCSAADMMSFITELQRE